MNVHSIWSIGWWYQRWKEKFFFSREKFHDQIKFFRLGKFMQLNPQQISYELKDDIFNPKGTSFTPPLHDWTFHVRHRCAKRDGVVSLCKCSVSYGVWTHSMSRWKTLHGVRLPRRWDCDARSLTSSSSSINTDLTPISTASLSRELLILTLE